ncbi:hypothetical protein VCHA52P455_120046 [Vibrio chagasii]|nr:hypothetical protein VCHA52P455_120046 [Vibrio chagasii]
MKSSSFRKLRLRRLKAMMYSFLDLGAFLLQGKKIQESAIQFLCINFSSNGDSVFSQALKSSRVG